MKKMKTALESLCESRKMAMPDEINPHGTLFGGVMMSWIDKMGYMCAQNYAEWKKTVTANIDQIQFLEPVYSGEHVLLSARVSNVGRSSMEIDVQIYKEDPVTKKKLKVGLAYMTFVAINPNGKSRAVPKLKLETPEDYVRSKNAISRAASRKALKEAYEMNEQDSYTEFATIAGNDNKEGSGNKLKNRFLIRMLGENLVAKGLILKGYILSI
ncbi:MAG TPA: acyl-CoA thioesterase [Bacteriovoracaceae bacterium]|nr:acyl-CoA thioesterase [Bacteriovoracaceae bacterium]